MNNEDNNVEELSGLRKGQNKKFSIFEVFILIIVSVIVSLSLGILMASHNNKKNKSTEEVDKQLQLFIENYNYIIDNYYEEIDKDKLINSAIAGMMDSLDDPYSAYIDDSSSNNFNITLEGSYQGLGISIIKDTETNYIVAYSVFKDSPADKAGLKPGDIIKSINGESTESKDATEFSNYILNSEEKVFTLTVVRQDEQFDLTIKKENVVIDSVTSKMIERDNKKIGYIYISIFANNTAKQFFECLNTLENDGMDALIIDVRSNTGGHLTAVEAILNKLLTTDQITYQLSQDGHITKYYGSLKEKKKYEIILIGDSYSASASEVLISSLKENLDSKLIGVKTYGKGTVQELITLSNGSQYKITTKKWLTPKGNWVNDTQGIVPDIEIELDTKYYQTLEDNDDNQLETAINYILNK